MKMMTVEHFSITQLNKYIKIKLKKIWIYENNFVYLYNKLEKYDRTNYTTY